MTAIYQYSSSGRLQGYDGNLDLNRAYMDGAAWDKYASPGKDASAPEPEPPARPAQIAVDGSFGPATVRRTQAYFGTPVDGIVSCQPASNRRYLYSAYAGCWQFLETGYGAGSDMVRAMQRKFGATVDGWAGKDTVLHMQAFLGVTRGRQYGAGHSIGVAGLAEPAVEENKVDIWLRACYNQATVKAGDLPNGCKFILTRQRAACVCHAGSRFGFPCRESGKKIPNYD